jgi:hypothetical protein
MLSQPRALKVLPVIDVPYQLKPSLPESHLHTVLSIGIVDFQTAFLDNILEESVFSQYNIGLLC